MKRIFYNKWKLMAMAMLKMDENVNLRLKRRVNPALFYYLLQILSYLAYLAATATVTATATATAKTMLKMDENVNLRLERDVNRALFYCLLYIVSYLVRRQRRRRCLRWMRMLIFDCNDMLTQLFFAVYGFSSCTVFYIFQNIGQ